MSDDLLADDNANRQEKIQPFRDADGNPRKMSRSEREVLIKEQFPSLQGLDWEHAFRKDTDLFGRIMRDVLKMDQREPGRSGPRRTLDYRQGMVSLREIMGEDYSLLPFDESFRVLAGKQSLRTISRKTGLSRTNCERLLNGTKFPELSDMTSAAKGYKKKPSYFLEYRAAVISAIITDRLRSAPESSIGYYRKLLEGQERYE